MRHKISCSAPPCMSMVHLSNNKKEEARGRKRGPEEERVESRRGAGEKKQGTGDARHMSFFDLAF